LPKLLIFAACEKAIIDQDHNVSLIGLIQDLKVEIPEQVDIEISKAEGLPVAAMRWAAFSMWLKTDVDSGKEYEQRVALIDPTGKPTGIEARTAFGFAEGKTTMRNTSVVLGFPVHASGRFMLRLWIHEKGQPESIEPIAEYPINLNRGQPKA
jgi:hypothetical protein